MHSLPLSSEWGPRGVAGRAAGRPEGGRRVFLTTFGRNLRAVVSEALPFEECMYPQFRMPDALYQAVLHDERVKTEINKGLKYCLKGG